jgi:hypothetical protein
MPIQPTTWLTAPAAQHVLPSTSSTTTLSTTTEGGADNDK